VYPDGKVCISILHAPGDDPTGYESAAERWQPIHTVRAFLLTLPTEYIKAWFQPASPSCVWYSMPVAAFCSYARFCAIQDRCTWWQRFRDMVHNCLDSLTAGLKQTTAFCIIAHLYHNLYQGVLEVLSMVCSRNYVALFYRTLGSHDSAAKC
jgi:hypothetical protein